MLEDGFHDVPPGRLATIVTHLEMRAPPAPRPAVQPAGAVLREVAAPRPDWYRDLFNRVGGQDWLWFSRLVLDDEALVHVLHDPRVRVFSLQREEQSEGLLELDFRARGQCELSFFGVTSALIGTGAGRYMMNVAIETAWSKPIERFHVHTCTLDHPAALSFYRRSGFVPVRQQVEIAPDPRLDGPLPRTAGAHVPLIL